MDPSHWEKQTREWLRNALRPYDTYAQMEHTKAVTRVFQIPELLEHILLDVARNEPPQPPKPHKRPSTFKKLEQWRYTWTPITLRAVNRTFRDCIDGSPELLRMRLQAVHPLGQKEFELRLPPTQLGALEWLKSRAELTLLFEYQRGVLHVTNMEFDGSTMRRDKAARRQLREDIGGSWRNISILAQASRLSSVKLKLMEPEEEKSFRGSWDLGAEATLGMVFDRIDKAARAWRDDELVALFGKMSTTCCEPGVDCPYH